MEGLLMEKVIRGREAGGFEVIPLRTAKEACQYLLANIPQDAVVGAGGPSASGTPMCWRN